MTYSRRHSVLVLSPALSQSRALAEWLKRTAKHIHIVGGTLFGSPHYLAKYPYDAVVDIVSPADLDGYHTVVPTGSVCTQWLVEHLGGFRVGEVFFSTDNLRVYEKPWLYSLARKFDVPVPDTWLNYQDIPDDGYPVFYKPRIEGVYGPRRPAKNRTGIPIYARGSKYLFQEYIPGREVYGYGFIARNGEVVVACQHREIASMPRDGGSAVAVRALNEPRIEALSRKLITAINYEGWGLIEFKYCPRRNDFVLMELNAKWWASLEYALRTEPNFGRLLFGTTHSKETLAGLFWPDRFLSALRGNIRVGIHAATRLPWSWDFKCPRPKSILAGIVPTQWVDFYRERRRQGEHHYV